MLFQRSNVPTFQRSNVPTFNVQRSNVPTFQRSNVLTFYLPLALLVTVTVGKAGAWENYFLETLWVACALAARGIARWIAAGGWRAAAVPALVLLQLALFVPGFERRSPAAEVAWLDEVRTESEALRATVAALPTDAIIWSEHPGVLAEAGRPVPLFVFGYTQFEKQGLWDPTPLTDRLATGSAPLLIQRWDAIADPLRMDRWSRTMLDASERGYTVGTRAGEWLQRSPLPFTQPDERHPLDEQIALVNWMALGTDGALAPPIELATGDPLAIHLLWQSATREETSLSSSVQLFAPDGSRIAQHDAALRGSGLGGAWPEGALVRDEHRLDVTTALPPGAYSLLLSLYESEDGTPRGSITLPLFKVSPPPPTATLSLWRDVDFAGGLRLLARDPLPEAAAAGETLTLRAQWSIAQPSAAPLTTFLHLIAPDGTLAAQLTLSRLPAHPLGQQRGGRAHLHPRPPRHPPARGLPCAPGLVRRGHLPAPRPAERQRRRRRPRPGHPYASLVQSQRRTTVRGFALRLSPKGPKSTANGGLTFNYAQFAICNLQFAICNPNTNPSHHLVQWQSLISNP